MSKSLPENVFVSSDEMIEKVKIFDSTVEMIGVVDVIEAKQVVGKNTKYMIFKFFIKNNGGHRVQVKVWNDEIQRVEHLIKMNMFLHIDGASAKPQSIGKFNEGTVPYELLIQSNTVITNYMIPKSEVERTVVIPKFTVFQEIASASTNIIRVGGYLKTPFNKVIDERTNEFRFTCGSITDGIYQLEIRIKSFQESIKIQKGEPIEVQGVMNWKKPVFLTVDSMNSITQLNTPRMTFINLLKGSKKIEKNITDKN
ncbi:uncharacterized protein LOC122499652 [Leptopilina heterotoma]|uniref:uncharacterized protein LOC122499652 n=1 Tax=Leptopilina heterotoma TaxID=63436 RepID=UPI001CA93133|nr:uncharacterized protein LOC122499652 [Leptopilina heterotoma]